MASQGGAVAAAPNIWSKPEQARLLGEAREKVRAHGFAMKRACDAGSLQEALKHGTLMVSELRTSLLSPKLYYELYMEVFDQLGFLEIFFTTLQRQGTPLSKIYEAVQLTGNVLPRLYLMITAGSVYIKSGQGRAREVLGDLLEMVKGVQHPQRGLFLRHYLAQKCKDRLPDLGSPYEGAAGGGGTLADAIGFVLSNFSEMNRLWVRLQHVYGASNKGKKRRERERLELRLLVGGQLSRLSMLSGLDAGVYASSVLPRILSEVVACRDRIAQPYLFECTLQAFPVDFTLATLGQLLDTLPRLVPDPSVAKACLGALFTRIREEALASTNILQEAAAAGDAAAKAALESSPKDNRLPGLRLLPSALASAAADSSSSSAPASSPVNVAELDVFGMLLAAVDTLTRDPAGPFRGGATAVKNATAAAASAAAGGASSFAAAGVDEDATAVDNAAAAAAAAAGGSKTPSAGSASATSGLSSPESLAGMLEAYTSLMAFANACYPAHLPYADAVLQGAAQSLREGLGLTGEDSADAASALKAAEAAKQAQEASAAQPKRKSALSRLTGGAGDADSAASASAAGGEAASSADASAGKGKGSGKGSGLTSSDPLSTVTLDDECSKLVVSLLAGVQQSLGLAVLSLDHYAPLMAPLRFPYRRSIAGRLLDAVLAPSSSAAASSTAPATAGSSSSGAGATPAGGASAATSASSSSVKRVASADIARRLLTTLLPLIRGDEGASSSSGPSAAGSGSGMVTITSDNGSEDHAFVSEQQRMAKLVLILGHTTDRGFNAAMNAAAAAAEAAQALQNASGEEEQATAKANLARAQQAASGLTQELDTDAHWEVLKVAAEALSHGGPRRLGFTFPPLVFACLQLLRRVRSLELAGKRGLKTNYRRGNEFLLNLLSGMAASSPQNNDAALRLSLQACLAVDSGFSEICDAFASQAFLCYEELTDSKQQAACLALIIGALQEVRALEVDKYEALVSRATLNSIKLLKKQDQVRCVLLCSKLFWRAALPGMEPIIPEGASEEVAAEGGVPPTHYHQPKELLQCLQKALSIADKAVPPQPSLFVQCFEAYVGHFERGVPSVSPQHLTDLVALCKEQVDSMRLGTDREELASHLKQLLGHIARAKAAAAAPGASSSASAAASAQARYSEVLLA